MPASMHLTESYTCGAGDICTSARVSHDVIRADRPVPVAVEEVPPKVGLPPATVDTCSLASGQP
jgi:hypothetical protein